MAQTLLPTSMQMFSEYCSFSIYSKRSVIGARWSAEVKKKKSSLLNGHGLQVVCLMTILTTLARNIPKVWTEMHVKSPLKSASAGKNDPFNCIPLLTLQTRPGSASSCLSSHCSLMQLWGGLPPLTSAFRYAAAPSQAMAAAAAASHSASLPAPRCLSSSLPPVMDHQIREPSLWRTKRGSLNFFIGF